MEIYHRRLFRQFGDFADILEIGADADDEAGDLLDAHLGFNDF